MNKNANLMQKYASSRNNLLLMLILTAVNIIMFVCGSYTMLLFSATIPYYLIVFGMLSESSTFLTACIFLALIPMILYLVCWIFSKKHYGWMIGALVLFSIDTAAMAVMYLGAGEVSGILDTVIHILVLYYLIIGVSSGAKLAKHKGDSVFINSSVEETSSASDTNEEL